MRVLVLLGLLAGTSPVLAEPGPLSLRAPAGQVVEVPAASPRPVRIRLALAHDPLADDALADAPTKAEGPTLMQMLRDRIVEQLPVVSTAVLAPLPVPSADGTLVGAGLVGKF